MGSYAGAGFANVDVTDSFETLAFTSLPESR